MATKSQSLQKDQILSALIEARQNILSKVSKLSKAQQDKIYLGIWSVKDLLAHFVGWDHTNLAAIQSVMDGHVPAFYEFHDHDWQTYNAMLVKKYKKDSFQELLASVKDSHGRLVEFLQQIPAEELNEDFGVRFHGYKVTIQRLLEAETKDEQTHYQQIIGFFKQSK